MAALSTAERAKVRMYLGYSNTHRYLNTRLEGAMDTIGDDDDVLTLVRAKLTALDAIDAMLGSGDVTLQAGVKRVDEVEYFPSGNGSADAITRTRSEGRRLVGILGTFIGVQPYADYFGDGLYPGDTYSEFGLLSRGRGGQIPIG